MYKFYKYLLFVFSITMLSFSNTYAYKTSDLTEFPKLLFDTSFVNDNFEINTIKTLNSKSERIKVAGQLIKQLNAFDQFLPDLSDNEILKLKEQRKSAVEKKQNFNKTFKQMEKSFSNPNLALYGLKGKINETRNALNCVVKSSDITIEMYCWTKASSLFASNIWSNDIKDLISSGKILNVKLFLFSSISDLGVAYNIQSEGILNFIVLPYLASQIPKSYLKVDKK